MQSVLEKAKKIKLAIFDIDGVLTDRSIYLSNTGDEFKAFNAHDGFGIKLLIKSGVEVGIITTRKSSLVEKRMAELGVTHIYQGQENKLPALLKLAEELQLTFEQIAYVGDDLPDLPLIRKVGLGVAVADAVSFVKEHADWRTQAAGGRGAAREVCDLIMQAQNTFTSLYELYL